MPGFLRKTRTSPASCKPYKPRSAIRSTKKRPRARTWSALSGRACNRGLGRGDTLVVVSIDRLGRSLSDLVGMLENFKKRGVHFRSLREGIDTTTAMGKMFCQISSAFAEYERALISERTTAGLQTAMAKGARMGRPPAKTDEQKATARRVHKTGETISAIAKILGVSRATVRRASTS